jgi:hypothetical protein
MKQYHITITRSTGEVLTWCQQGKNERDAEARARAWFCMKAIINGTDAPKIGRAIKA